MLVKPSLEDLLNRVENRYILAMLAARRARQITSGAQTFVKQDNPSNVTLAAEEISEDKIALLSGNHKVNIPLRPEIEEARRIAALEAEAKRREEYMEESSHRSASNLSRELSQAVGGDGEADGAEMLDFTQQFINLIGQQDEARAEAKKEAGMVVESVRKLNSSKAQTESETEQA
ncbi:MAG: DNA-directed RNA polymerase subunit omega [Eubacteriales bacterium]|nr:DNA-directed RNA polymerase subunit omega [Eubacteriales bacterium]